MGLMPMKNSMTIILVAFAVAALAVNRSPANVEKDSLQESNKQLPSPSGNSTNMMKKGTPGKSCSSEGSEKSCCAISSCSWCESSKTCLDNRVHDKQCDNAYFAKGCNCGEDTVGAIYTDPLANATGCYEKVESTASPDLKRSIGEQC
eukprot:jgi/Bigna1/70065/fgenesh1_pg.10_\